MAKDKDAHFNEREKKGLRIENEGKAASRKAAIQGRQLKGEMLKSMRDAQRKGK